MKIRNGFVSNSSSSSFVIRIKEDADLEETLTKIFSLPENHPLYQFAVDARKFLVYKSKLMTKDDVLSDYGYESVEEATEDGSKSIELLKEGYKLFRVSASHNESDDPAELFIGNSGLNNIDLPDFMMIQEY